MLLLPGKAPALPLPLPSPEICFSPESGAWPEEEITVTVTAPEGYRIACTLDGRRPTLADDCGASTLSLTLEKEEAGTLLRQKDRLLCPLDTPLLESAELPCGRILRRRLADPGLLSRRGLCRPLSRLPCALRLCRAGGSAG